MGSWKTVKKESTQTTFAPILYPIMNQPMQKEKQPKLGGLTPSNNPLPWTQEPKMINIKDLSKELNEVKLKKNELIRKEKELMIKFKDHYEKNGLSEFEDAEENKFAIGEVLVERREVKRWTYTNAIKELQEEEKARGVATLTESFSWIFNEAKK